LSHGRSSDEARNMEAIKYDRRRSTFLRGEIATSLAG
jgi:hypothetical protein